MTWSQKRSSKPPIRTSFRPEFKKWSTYLVCDKAKEQNEVATKEKQPKNLQGCSKNIYVSESVFLDGKTGALEMVTSYDLPVVAVENGFKSWTQWIPSKTSPFVSASPTWPIVLVPKAIQGFPLHSLHIKGDMSCVVFNLAYVLCISWRFQASGLFRPGNSRSKPRQQFPNNLVQHCTA